MLKRTLFFGNSYHLYTRNEQLIIASKETGEEKTAPIEDLGFVVLDHPHITFTQSVTQLLSANNVGVVFCNEKHLPSSMLFHLDTNQVQNERFRAQVDASKPLKKQLWQQTVKAKIRNQAALLAQLGKNSQALHRLATDVKSGDPTNREAKAARMYWKSLFGEKFRRERYGASPNNMLNYGYAILRAAVARSLAGSGLLPTLGIHHRNKYNAYCLADDIMEPYRPFVDSTVVDLYTNHEDTEELTKELKGALISITSSDVRIGSKTRPLMIALAETTASLSSCFEGKSGKLKYAELP